MLAGMGEAGDHPARAKNADFTGARFLDDVSFESMIFEGRTHFTNATFEKDASFYGAKFDRYASFHDATFNGLADFEHASFGQVAFKRIEFASAIFRDVTFGGLAEFISVNFNYTAEFNSMVAEERAVFTDCWFDGSCNFQNAKFHGNTSFGGSSFAYQADFGEASFSKSAHFVQNEFADNAAFAGITFYDEARFDESTFQGGAWFFDSVFSGASWFVDVKFGGDVVCRGARFVGEADFGGAQVAGTMSLESAGGCGELRLDGLRADGVVEVTGPFAKVRCADAAVRGRAWFRLMGSELWLDNSEFSAPLTVESRVLPSSADPGTVTSAGQPTRLRSLDGTDAEHLTLVDVDLSRCELAGLRRPESLRLVGGCRFAPMPRGLYLRPGRLPWWWSARDALFEEHVWRLSIGAPARKCGWERPDPGQEIEVKPDRLAVMYRQLRAVLEDARNEPGANDLYYGEMEMRRAASRVGGERCLLWMYWLVSGYGLRAVRSLMVLAGVILAAAAAFRYVGFPGVTPGYQECLVYAGGAVLSLDLASRHLPDVLTEWGDVVRIGLRVAGPVLLGLAALAVRGRVKR
jgi:uncharacterized protein YjbI with pentapeptide repeats